MSAKKSFDNTIKNTEVVEDKKDSNVSDETLENDLFDLI